MFVGFIAVVVILLVIVGLMSSGALNSGADTAAYTTEVKKTHALFSQIQDESKFYYAANNESYKDISMEYFKSHKFGGAQMVASGNMSSADWSGWPAAADPGSFADPYLGPYIKVGGPAGDQMRIVVVPINNGQSAAFHVLRKTVNTIPSEFVILLEKTLASDPNYIGG